MADKHPSTIDLHYIKSNDFSISHVDGALGGITPKGNIEINFFLERMPIPQIVTHDINDDGSLGSLTIKKGREGIIRQVDHGIIMNLDTAKKINVWLKDHIDTLENLIHQGDFSDSEE